MSKLVDGVPHFAPLYIHSLRLIAPKKLVEAERFNRQFHRLEDIPDIPDKLRWCRHHLGLTQTETADRAGISRSAYMKMEKGEQDCFEKEAVDKLAVLFGVSPFDLLDDYNRFRYLGQGKMALACRERLGMSRREFAGLLGISESCVFIWETERKRMTKKSWEKYYADKL